MENQNNENIINENKALKIENENLKNLIRSLKNENQFLKTENLNLKNNFNYFDSINKEIIKELEEKCKILKEEIEKIKSNLISKLNYNAAEIKNYNELPDGEKLVAVNFVSIDQRINYSIVCKNKTNFYEIEGNLYRKYPEYKKYNKYFMFCGSKIERWNTLEENGIHGYTIVLNKID